MSSRTPRINLYAPKTLAVMDQAFAGLHGLPSRRSVARDNFPEKFTSHTGGSTWRKQKFGSHLTYEPPSSNEVAMQLPATIWDTIGATDVAWTVKHSMALPGPLTALSNTVLTTQCAAWHFSDEGAWHV
jgi:hypothetical protein